MLHPHDLESHLEPWTVRIAYLAKELKALGHEIAIAYHCLGEPGDPRPLPGTEIMTIPLVRFSRTLIRKTGIIRELAAWADLIHFQKCFAYTALPAISAAYSVGLPVHYDWDDWEYEIYNYRPNDALVGRLINRLERGLPSLVDTISVASEALRELCISLGFPQELIVKVPVGADITRFHPDIDGNTIRERHDLSGPIVLYVGQLHGAQYLEHLLQAFVGVRRRHPETTLLVVGGGDRFGELHALGEQLGINDATVFTGPVPHEEVPQYMAAAEVAVACFDDNRQTRCKSPLKIVEYLAMGKAIVGTDMGEVSQMLGGGAGLLYRPGDTRGLGRAICQLLESTALRRSLQCEARRRSCQVYNWQASAQVLAGAYEMAAALQVGRRRRVFRATLEPRRTAPEQVEQPQELKLGPWPFRSSQLLSCNRDLIGMLDGERAFAGPALVQLDVTNSCNNDCIACWCNSPLLGERRMAPEVRRQSLPFDRIEELLHELKQMGTREIYMAGGGEPFMHPQIMEIIRTIKQLGFVLYINTNFTLVDQHRARELADLAVDHLTVSLWAGSAATYALVHPNKTEESFAAICDTLRLLSSVKTGPPYVKLYHVISCLNYHELPEMVRIAHATGCESVEMTLVDTIPGATESLLLSEPERLQALALLEQARREAEQCGVTLFHYELFARRLDNVDSVHGHHDSNIVQTLPCTIGWTFSRILPDGNVNACLKAHRIPVGNILRQSFSEIWNGPQQREFRSKTAILSKDDPYFRQIGNDPEVECGCIKSCDDIGRNTANHERMQALTWWQRRLLMRSARQLARKQGS